MKIARFPLIVLATVAIVLAGLLFLMFSDVTPASVPVEKPLSYDPSSTQ